MKPFDRWTLGPLALLVLLNGASAWGQADADRQARIEAARQAQQIALLRRVALGRDDDKALEAMGELAQMGPSARDDLVRALRGALARTGRLASRALRGAGDRARLAEYEAKLAAERDAAWANIAKLEKGEPVAKAHAHYETLKKMYAELGPIYQRRAAAVEALSLRQRYVELWEQVASDEDKAQIAAEQAELAAAVKDALGMSLDEAIDAAAFNHGKAPNDPAKFSLWHAAAADRIDAYNQQHIKPLMDRAEWENAAYVNDYRRWLGALPYELDARLIQAARRHSKDMVDRGYFSHTGKNAANKTHTKRMANAGYKGGYSENIAYGSASGAAAFWQWFDSPGHHKNMVARDSISLGVGRWASTWTQNMGRGKRLMLQPDAKRDQAKVKGEILKPGR